MASKAKPVLISGSDDTEIELKRAAVQKVLDVATLESLQILEKAIDKHGEKINGKLKSYKGFIV